MRAHAGALVHWLLKDVFNVTEGADLTFTNSLPLKDGREVGLDWALGAVVMILVAAPGLAQQQVLWWALVFSALLCGAAVLLELVVATRRLTISSPLRPHHALAGVLTFSRSAASFVNVRLGVSE